MSRVWLRSPGDNPADLAAAEPTRTAPAPRRASQPARASGVVPGCPKCNPDGRPGGGNPNCDQCRGTGTG